VPASERLLQAIAVTAELTGTQLSTPAARVMADDLGRFPEAQVLGALTRCRKELKGRLTIADVVTRLDDGRPGVEEAWAMIPKTEGPTVVWTEEMATAYGVALPLIDEDPVAARMAFKEAYSAAVGRARDEGRPAKWTPCLGHDVNGREAPLLEAVKLGRLTAPHVQGLLPGVAVNPEVLKLMRVA
jgi:hypothetical protein